jgi:threonine dehydratase
MENYKIPSAEDLVNAKRRIELYINETPILTSTTINNVAGCQLFFKCENFQKVGAFKYRGATNAILQLSEAARQNGVATHSSGNHAQALALAAKVQDIKAFIVMPTSAPEVKIDAVKGYGAEITFCEPTLQAREQTLAKVVARTGATEIHPFDNDQVICGQATAAMELLEDVDHLEVILAPIGGGGLISGTALAAKYFGERVQVIGGEPEGASDAYRSFVSGVLEPSINPHTIADGLLTSLSPRTFNIIKQNVKEVITVTDAQIITAMKLLWERMKIVLEPSSAVPFAALLRKKKQFEGKKVGIIISGGNVDLSHLPF